jgi:glutamyl-tRNA reductase
MILIVGLSHRTAPLELREALAFAREGISEDLKRLRQRAAVAEAMILSTCNRVELYAAAADEASLARLTEYLASSHSKALAEIDGALYRLSGDDAVRHAFRVTASLDSMVVGESQILGQVKEAYQIAEQAGTLAGGLLALRDRSIAAAKRVRSSTAIGRNAVSVSHVAVELARKIYGDMRGREVLLIGTGKMSEIAARHLVEGGARATVVGGRRFERACELANALGGTAVPFESLGQELTRADVVISGTAAPGLVVSRAQVEQASAARRHRPLFLIDIAVPRDIEPSVRELRDVFLYDLDDLKAVAEANLRERQREAQEAEVLVEQGVREYLEWQRARDVVPVLVELRQRADQIRRAEIERARKHLGPLTPEQEQAIEHLTSAIVQKLLHAPSVQLKALAGDGHPAAEVSFLRRLLGL